MSLPKIVGDLLQARQVALVTTKGGPPLFQSEVAPVLDALERQESVLWVHIQADPGNTGRILVGTGTVQPWVLRAGETLKLEVSRASLLALQSQNPASGAMDVANILIVRTTGELARPAGA